MYEIICKYAQNSLRIGEDLLFIEELEEDISQLTILQEKYSRNLITLSKGKTRFILNYLNELINFIIQIANVNVDKYSLLEILERQEKQFLSQPEGEVFTESDINIADYESKLALLIGRKKDNDIRFARFAEFDNEHCYDIAKLGLIERQHCDLGCLWDDQFELLSNKEDSEKKNLLIILLLENI